MTPQETDPDLPMSVQESLAVVWVSGGLLQGQGTELAPLAINCHEILSRCNRNERCHFPLCPGEKQNGLVNPSQCLCLAALLNQTEL